MQKAGTFGLIITALLFCFFTGCASQNTKPDQTLAPPSESTSNAAGEAEDATDYLLTAEEEALFGDEEDEWEDEQDTPELALVADPIEPFNRAMFYFNDKLYTWVLRPVALGYRKVTPEKARIGVSNFFSNLLTPVRFANCLLQGKGEKAATEFARLVTNSTVGLFGFVDVLKDHPELQQPDKEDLGQTLGTWGMGDGFYIVWPVLGSSTLRDTAGLAGDAFLNPVTYMDNTEAALAVRGFERVNTLTFRIEDIDAAKKAAFDPYEATRNFYIQFLPPQEAFICSPHLHLGSKQCYHCCHT